jgi:hypothetical protein
MLWTIAMMLQSVDRPTNWLPQDVTAETRCPVPAATRTPEMPDLAWDSIIYVSTDDDRAAERAIRIQPGLTWSVADDSDPGLHERVSATGIINAEGVLVGLPPEAFAGATDVWSYPVICSIGTEAIPSRRWFVFEVLIWFVAG